MPSSTASQTGSDSNWLVETTGFDFASLKDSSCVIILEGILTYFESAVLVQAFLFTTDLSKLWCLSGVTHESFDHVGELSRVLRP